MNVNKDIDYLIVHVCLPGATSKCAKFESSILHSIIFIAHVHELFDHTLYVSRVSYGDVTITNEGLQILTYTLHSLRLSSEGFLVPHLL